jgi:hypothetical protein
VNSLPLWRPRRTPEPADPRHRDEEAMVDQAWTFVHNGRLQDPDNARWPDVDADFAAACARAVRWFRAGNPGRGRYELARSAERCARYAAERDRSPVPPTTLVCVCHAGLLKQGVYDPGCAAVVHGGVS